ncbi:MAG: glycosyltransferase family 39 protein [Parcubacteria group bacterium]|nr:glycosyltransferase family 39 protein [Parcubacteria group bacterium]
MWYNYNMIDGKDAKRPYRDAERLKEKWILIAILLIAFIFRFQNITTVPTGLYPDEAINGNNALIALETGDYKVFYPENNGREGLFINIQALFLKLFGAETWALRAVSAGFGFLTVLGLYLLVRLLFNWQIASIAGFYLAVSFWHVVFSRIGFRAIMIPFLIVWGFYFLWRGLRDFRFRNFALSGLIFGLGFHTYIAFRFVPFIVISVLLAYWWEIKKDYGLEKYMHLRNEFLRRFALFFLIAFLTALPILYYFWQNPDDFIGRGGQVSIFEAAEPLKEFLKSLGLTLASFNFTGDFNWRHNFSGSPLLFWPVGVFFIIGLLKSMAKMLKKGRGHGHPAVLHVFLLSWFFIMLLPSALTREGIPHALRSIGVLPAVMIFAAEGTWWFFETLIHWYREKDRHPLESPHKKEKEARLFIGAALILLLASIGFAEYDKYFNQWAKRPEVQDAFSADFAEVGKQINQLPKEIPKYVVVNVDGVLADGIPMPAQTVMFITQTYTQERQKEKNVFYILPGEENSIKESNAVLFKLVND